MYALIHDGIVWEMSPDPNIWTSLQDVRDVSAVAGIAVGWTVSSSGTFAAPVVRATVADLIAYANTKQLEVLATLKVSFTPSGMAVALETMCDARSLAFLSWKRANWVTPNYSVSPAPTCSYENLDGSVVAVTPAQLAAFLSFVDTRVQATFDAKAEVRAMVTASNPTITSIAQIEAHAWPAS